MTLSSLNGVSGQLNTRYSAQSDSRRNTGTSIPPTSCNQPGRRFIPGSQSSKLARSFAHRPRESCSSRKLFRSTHVFDTGPLDICKCTSSGWVHAWLLCFAVLTNQRLAVPTNPKCHYPTIRPRRKCHRDGRC